MIKNNFIKLSVLSFYLWGVSNAIFAKDVVFDASKDHKYLFITKDEVTINICEGNGDFGNKDYPFYTFKKDSKIKITSCGGHISKIIFTWKDKKSGPGHVNLISTGIYNDNETEGVWTEDTETGATDTVNFEMYSIVHAASITVTIEPDTINIKNTIDEDKPFNPITAGISDVSLRRTFNANVWNTLVLPFDLSAEQVLKTFGTNTKIADYIGAKRQQDGSYTLCFEVSTTGIKANTPVFIRDTEAKESYEIHKVTVTNQPPTCLKSGFDFIGTYNETKLNVNDYFISSDNKFYQANGTEPLKATHAAFRSSVQNGSNHKIRLSVSEQTTAIKNVFRPQASADHTMYNLSGQRVSTTFKGIIICEGKKIVQKP